MEKQFVKLTLFIISFLSIHGLSAQCSDLFISEYIEGSSYNKAIEIYNPTSDTIDLSDYEIQLFSNGSSTASQTYTSTFNLAAYSTYVVAHTSANTAIQTASNDLSGSLANFNGDDAIALINTFTGDTLDVIGVIGIDPGSSWSVSGTNSANGSTANRTLVRDPSVQEGNKDWSVSSTSEWMVFATDMADSLGAHTANCPASTVALASSITIDSTVSCHGGTDGGATVFASGGTAPYTYLWSNSDTDSSITGLSAGNYYVTITDVNSSTIVDTATISEPTSLSASITIDSNVSCHGGSNGSLSVAANGGTAPYTYTWSNNATTDSLSNVAAGMYTVTVTDANSCTTTDSAVVSQPAALSVTVTIVNNVSINGGSDGKAYATASGGTTPYTYTWPWAALTDTASNLAAGTYTVTVSDNNACTSINSFVITEPAVLTSSIAVDSNVSCHGFQDGGLTANAGGGVTPYSYLWSNSDTTASIDSLSSGNYTVTISDANGATVVDSGTVSEPAVLSVTTTVVNHVSFGASDGKAYATASGGTAPYIYSWAVAAIGDTISNLSAGNYHVTVTDANGCFVVDSVNLIVLSNHIPKLVITEIMYNAAESGTDTTEYIEILNADTAKVALNAFRFSNGITHTFGALDSIAVGDYAIIAYDSSAFRNRYGFDADFIWTSGELSNSGELIVLADQFGRPIDSVDYDDATPWPSGSNAGDPDGGGASIELTDSSSNNMLGQNWISSATAVQGQIINGFQVYGTPGSGPLSVGLYQVSAVELKNFSFYPNPNNGQLTIEVNANFASKNLPIQIYDLSGKVVYEGRLSTEREVLHLNKLSNGVYLIRIQNETKKLIIKK